MDKNYGGVIWTNHALERLEQRGIKQGDAWATWKRPDVSRYAASRGGWVYERAYGNTKIEVVAKKSNKGKWLILSVWSKPIIHRQAKNGRGRKGISVVQKILKVLKLA